MSYNNNNSLLSNARDSLILALAAAGGVYIMLGVKKHIDDSIKQALYDKTQENDILTAENSQLKADNAKLTAYNFQIKTENNSLCRDLDEKCKMITWMEKQYPSRNVTFGNTTGNAGFGNTSGNTGFGNPHGNSNHQSFNRRQKRGNDTEVYASTSTKLTETC